MYDLSLTMLLMLPSFSHAAPTQPIDSLALVATGPSTVNAIGPEPIDTRFSMEPRYQGVPLDEDDCLVSATQLLGGWGSNPFTQAERTPMSYWDDFVPRVGITIQSPRTGGPIETRFLVWGLYQGIKDMIDSNRFRNVQFILRWDRQIVGFISIKKRTPSLPGTVATNLTNTLQQRSTSVSSSDSVNLFVSESQMRTSFNISVQNPPSASANDDLAVKIEALRDKPMAKYAVIMAVIEGILAVASRPCRSHVPVIVQVQPPAPYGGKLTIVPERAVSGRPYLTFGIVAIAIRQIPATLLLQAHAWVEVRFRIEVNDVLVARGGISMP